MLSRLAFGAVAVTAAVAFVVAVPFTAQSHSFGAQPGFAGNIADGTNVRTCNLCHGDFALDSGTGAVLITAPPTVAPGQTVPITVTVVNTTPPAEGSTPRQGFQATVRNHAEPVPATQSALSGTLVITDAVHTGQPPSSSGAVEYVTHTQTGTSQTTWTFDWTAPAEPTMATVYASGNAANGGDGTVGDYIYSARATIAVMPVAGEARPEPLTLTLAAPHPNPTRSAATVRLTLATAATVAVRLVDGRGRTVRAQVPHRLPAGIHPLVLATSGLAPGTYFVVAEADGARQTQPLVVTR